MRETVLHGDFIAVFELKLMRLRTPSWCLSTLTVVYMIYKTVVPD